MWERGTKHVIHNVVYSRMSRMVQDAFNPYTDLKTTTESDMKTD